MLLNLSSFC